MPSSDSKVYDGGMGDCQLGPVSAPPDYLNYCVVYRILPLAIQRSEIEVVWLMKEVAMEGVDYEVDRLTAMWDITTREDEMIILRNQQGINASMYQPAPPIDRI